MLFMDIDIAIKIHMLLISFLNLDRYNWTKVQI